MQETYCLRWNSVLNKPIDPMSREQARQRDASGVGYYTVVLGDVTQPACYLEVNRAQRFIGVNFLDARCRPWLAYSFRGTDERTMFLESVLRWEYPDDEAPAMMGATLTEELRYERDGQVRREVRDDVAAEVRSQRITDVPLDINWEPVPEFGQWASIARIDREPVSGR